MLTDLEWERLKTAAIEYAAYRPKLVYEAFVPLVGLQVQTVPENTIGVESINYGVELTLAEVMTPDEGVQGWCFSNGLLYLTPAPADATPLNIVWRQLHPADEIARTFPTISATDMLLVQMLADAVEADEEQA